MEKKTKIIIIIAVCVVCALLIVGGVLYGVKEYKMRNVFAINDNLARGNGKKAKVILLAGQSNAAGCSFDAYLEKNVSAEQYAAYKGGYDNVYINYFASGNNESHGFVKAATGQGETTAHFGPELGLAEKLHEEYPDDLFFIIKYTWSGTNLFEQWLSPSSDGKTGYLYRNLIRYVKKSMDYLISKEYVPTIEGLCWMQGESDSFSVENATNYEIHLKNFIADVREDLSKYASADGIAFVDAYIAANPIYWVYCDLVNASKSAVADDSEMNVLIDTNAYGLTCANEPEENPDMAHYDSMSQILLGHLFGEQVIAFFDKTE